MLHEGGLTGRGRLPDDVATHEALALCSVQPCPRPTASDPLTGGVAAQRSCPYAHYARLPPASLKALHEAAARLPKPFANGRVHGREDSRPAHLPDSERQRQHPQKRQHPARAASMAVRARWEAQAQRAKQLQGESAAEQVPGQDSPLAAAQPPGSAKAEPPGPAPGPEPLQPSAGAPGNTFRAIPAPATQLSPVEAAAVKQSGPGSSVLHAGPSAAEPGREQRGPQPQVLQSGRTNLPPTPMAGLTTGAEPDITEQPAMAEQQPIGKLGSVVGQHESTVAFMDSA